MRETLDEAIDRVAAAMTTVEHSVEHREIREFGERRKSPESLLPDLPDLPVLLAAAATVLMAALLLDGARELERPTLEATLPRVAETVGAAPSAPEAVEARSEPVSAHDVIRHEFVDPDIPPRPTIAGLTGPSVLTVDELSLESLAVAPVEVVDLEDPPSLELPALDMSRPGEFR